MPGISCGVVGLPNVGKSTLFNALTKAGAKVENYPFCTIDPNVSVVSVPYATLQQLNAVEGKSREVPAVVEFVDIAGLVAGASKGEGRGNQFLEHVRHVDLLVHVVRCFQDQSVAHIRADLDPLDDIRIITLELVLADLQAAQNAIDRLQKKARTGDKLAREAAAALGKLQNHLDTGGRARTAGLSTEQWKTLREIRFLTAKRVLYVANVHEDSLPDGNTDEVDLVREFAAAEENSVLAICAKMEAEIAEFEPEEGVEFAEEMGLLESGLDRLIRECYEQLGLITFFTVGDEEVRAWTVRAGATAPQAGGVIHSDFEDLFIRAEVIGFEDFKQCGSRSAAKEEGLMRVEGKDYLVQDGDILFFRIGR